MNDRTSRISLADWISNIRQNLEEGIRRRRAEESTPGGALGPSFLVDEITLEATVETERTEGLGPKLTCMIAEISGEQKTSRNAMQKVTIRLKPVQVIHLGSSPGPADGVRQMLPETLESGDSSADGTGAAR